jgi:hypothetical protein
MMAVFHNEQDRPAEAFAIKGESWRNLDMIAKHPAEGEQQRYLYLLNALDSEIFTLAQLTESINKTLAEEENGESVTLPQVRACVNFKLKVATKKNPTVRVIEEDGTYRLAEEAEQILKKPVTVK